MTTLWDESYPPSLFVPPVIPLTGVTAGTPGAFAPADATIPANITELRADPVIGNTGTNKPVTAWTTGQHVVLGNSAHAYWDAASWQTGGAPLATTAQSASKTAQRGEEGQQEARRRDKR
jgi:hypothetical protein